MSSPPSNGALPGAGGSSRRQELQSQREGLAGSQYATVASAVIVDQITRSRYLPSGRSIRDAQEPLQPQLSSSKQSNPKADPLQPLHSERQRRLYNALQLGGIAGVAYGLYEESERLKDKCFSYRLMVDDRSKGQFYVLMLLLSLPKEVIESLIQGTLDYDRLHSPVVKAFYRDFMAPSEYLGIYPNSLTHPGTQTVNGNPAEEGRYLSTNDIKTLITGYRNYMTDNGDHINDLVDRLGKKDRRHWANTPQRREIGRSWCRKMEEKYVKGMDPTKMDVLHLSAPSEVGTR